LVVFVVSPVWAESKWCLAEFLLAKSLNKRVFAVIVEPTSFSELPTEMTAEWQITDLTAGLRDYHATVTLPGGKTTNVALGTEGLDRLRIGLVQSGLDPKFFAWPPANDPDRAPYRGLLPLDADPRVVMAVSISPSLRTGAMIGPILSDRAAVSNEGIKVDTRAVSGLNMIAARLSPGAISESSSSHLPASEGS
jgi:hypothetical protein